MSIRPRKNCRGSESGMRSEKNEEKMQKEKSSNIQNTSALLQAKNISEIGDYFEEVCPKVGLYGTRNKQTEKEHQTKI